MKIVFYLLAIFVITAWAIQIPLVQTIDQDFIQAVITIRHPLLTKFFHFLTNLGSSAVILLFMLIITLVILIRKRTVSVWYMYLFFFLERILNETSKKWIARERPSFAPLVDESSFSFPSGHSMNAASMYAFFAFFLLMDVPYFRRHRTAVYIWTGALVILIGGSRIYLGVHYLTDVIGGFSLGFLLFFMYKKIAENFLFVRQN
ncbi:phosphatase PAP2 family protein [Bacillus sp. CLL-7-23]|uniref:Phosphatase PAP2 family protein n=1 Tax=Bacillus changyiensis TaxID=3004103 RepID=A0ABT4X063_9BACI|nr:phosphatase PAP2 family protein [Bacillus changyiensis]MDA7025685.1 phosphatase PAP2 family protein [Bacillus changyiensis]